MKERVRVAIEALLLYDGELLDLDAGERTLAARLAGYLQPLFPGLNVDVEYNRHGLDPKTLDLPVGCPETGEHRVIPDVIVHERRTDDQNLLVIEMKKRTNPTPRDCDLAKIRGMIDQLRYRFGLFLEFEAGPDRAKDWPTECWFSEET